MYGAGHGAGDVATMAIPARMVANAAKPGSMIQGAAETLASSPGMQLASAMSGEGVGQATQSPTLGFVTSLAVPAGMAGARGAARMIADRFNPPKPDQRAGQYVMDVLGKSGTSIDNLSAVDASRPITAAEAMGPNGKTQLMALARREGETGAALQSQMSERAADRSSRIADDMAQAAGIHPEAAKGNIDALVAAGQAKAGPLFTSALARQGPVWNEDLARLAQRPAIQKAIALAVDDLKMATSIQARSGLSEPLQRAVDDVKYARSALPTDSTLFSAIKKAGGIAVRDAAGNLTPEGQNIMAALKDVRQPGLINKLEVGGLPPDKIREQLQEHGWFSGQGSQGGRVHELYDAMHQEAQGSKYYHPDSSIHGELDARAELDREFANAGITASDKTVTAAQKLATYRMGMPDSSSAKQLQPTAQAWDVIRRNLNTSVERDAFGKPIPDSISRGNYNINQASRDLTGALKRAIPGYDKALAVSGDYLSARTAFDQGQKSILNGNVTEKQFADLVGKMTPADQEALKGGIANRLSDMAQNGRLAPKQFLTPHAQAKLVIGLGKDQAETFLDGLRHEAQMSGFERAAVPSAGSQTAPLGAAMRAQDTFGQSQIGSDLQNAILSGKGARGIATDVAGGWAARKAQQLAAALRTSGLNTPARNEAGKLLLSQPGDLADTLRRQMAQQLLRGAAPATNSYTQQMARTLMLNANPRAFDNPVTGGGPAYAR